MENIFELFDKLLKFPKELIQVVLIQLMIKGKIDFLDINKAYVKYLEVEKEDKTLKLADANSCTLNLLNHIKKETESNKANIHWALYNLNMSKQFNMKSLNEKFGYNEENDCKYSFYWREHNQGKW